MKLMILLILSAFLISSLPQTAFSATLAQNLRGYVLLQVQQHGEAWYVSPKDLKRYYMNNGPAAYDVMRYQAYGISESDFVRLQGSSSMRSIHKGKVFLRVQAHGEAYYICPKNLGLNYLKDGAAAFNVMRQCGLGITDANLALIPVGGASKPTTAPVSNTGSASFAGCSIFPADSTWNQDISNVPLHSKSAAYVNSIGSGRFLHPDFGGNGEYGIPFDVVSGTQRKVPINFTAYGDESDPGPYPIPDNAKQESGGDAHVIALDKDNCILYELFAAEKTGTGWNADSGAKFDLKTNALRPLGWTSADAAGLPIFPGLVKFDEVTAGKINHAIRFTAPRTQDGYILPATHEAGSNDSNLPPMGLRMRLKANFDISGYTGQSRVILEAMKKYGLILADNGSSWYFQGDKDSRWNDDDLNQLKRVPGSAFEAVYTGEIRK